MRFKFPRESYIPKVATKMQSRRSSAVVYLSALAGKCYAVGFFGKADKPAFNYSFRDAKRRAQYVSDWMRSMDDVQARKDKAKSDRKAMLGSEQKFLKAGDVLYTSWGYDQTNIDYYEVIELVGKRKVQIREIGCERIEDGFMSGKSVPTPGNYIGKAMLKIVNEYGGVRIASYATATKLEQVMVDGKPVAYKPQSWTAYA